MTAEVAIINRQAIALAADSAVTVSMFDRTKIYNSANKLFALSAHYPVGIMIYGGALLTGVPWETLIKVYRKTLDSSCFPKLQDYCENFLAFIEKNLHFFREEDQTNSIQIAVRHKLLEILQENREKVQKTISREGQVTKSQTKTILENVIDSFQEKLESIEFLDNFNVQDRSKLEKKHMELFEKLVDELFDDVRITVKTRKKLVRIASDSLVRKVFSPGTSGVVIAGFGDEEIFPNLITYDIECILNGKIKYQKNAAKSYNNSSHCAIIPFAQEEMVFTFIGGIDPLLEEVSRYFLDDILGKYFEAVSTEVRKGNTDKETIEKFQKDIEQLRRNLVANFDQKTREYKQTYHIDPILNTVSILPKDELAAMAEALVNLTSLKRRVSDEPETVGGPTDVALISKGDGFVWVRRKHYFNSELNPDFFANKIGSMLASYKGGDASG